MKWVPAFLLLLICSALPAQTTRPIPLRADHAPRNGFALFAGDVPISRGSALCSVAVRSSRISATRSATS